MRVRLALVGALWLASPVAAQDAAGWMARMHEALASRDFHGDLVYAHGSQIETLRWFHATGPDGERERLVSTSGAPREVVREGGRILCVGMGPTPTLYGRAAGAPLLGALAQARPILAQHYLLALGGAERIAGLDTQLIEIRPRDAYRYGYRLWLERGSGLPLKSMRFGADGRAVEQILFTRIALDERPAEADLGLAQHAGAVESTLHLPEAGAAVPVGWQVLDPPDGFTLHLARSGAAADTAHLVYSDGIAHVSVYVEPLRSDAPAFSGPASRGPVSLYGRVLDGRQVTVLGDVPPATVERFAQGVSFAEG